MALHDDYQDIPPDSYVGFKLFFVMSNGLDNAMEERLKKSCAGGS